MSIQMFAAILLALFTLGLLIMVSIAVTLKEDPITMYKLFKVRDLLVRLVAMGKIERFNPHFDAIYRNVNDLLTSGHQLSGPDGWAEAKIQGQLLARDPGCGKTLAPVPGGNLPEALDPVMKELLPALLEMVGNHFGIFIQIDSQRRELQKIQKEKAKEFLAMMPPDLAYA